MQVSFKLSGQEVTDIPLTAIDDQPVSSLADLQTFIQQTSPDQEVTLTLLRNGAEMKVPVTLSERPAPAAFVN